MYICTYTIRVYDTAAAARSRTAHIKEYVKRALQLVMNRYGKIHFAHVHERISTASFVVLIGGNSKSNHLGARGAVKHVLSLYLYLSIYMSIYTCTIRLYSILLRPALPLYSQVHRQDLVHMGVGALSLHGIAITNVV